MTPLAGRTILVTRSREQAGLLTGRLEQLGANVLQCPVIDFAEPEDWSPVDRAIDRIADYSLVIFTSVNAVDKFLDRFRSITGTLQLLGESRIVAIGPATAARLEESSVPVGAVASSSRAEGLVDVIFSGDDIEGKKVLLPRAAAAREILPEALRRMGADLDVVTVYRTIAIPVPEPIKQILAHGGIDMVTFTSSSTVTNLLDALGGPSGLGGAATAVIGPVTAGTLRKRGLEPDVMAGEASMLDLAEGIAKHFVRVSS